MLNSGAILQSRYRILRQLGGGGMGTVYLAEDTRLSHSTCAIKEMSPGNLAPAERQWAIQAFQQEAGVLAQLRHPGLTRVTDFFVEGSCWYLVLDFVEGETLEARLARTGRLSIPEAQEIFRQLCDVLDYLHHLQPPIIFRDLKPANIMLTPAGEVKLIDFGIARFFKPGQTRDTVNLGTPGYAAPEQYGGMGQSDPRTDVYSLGAVLLQMITGFDPTMAVTPFPLPSPGSILRGLPPKIEHALVRATQLEPGLRFGSIREFQHVLLDSISNAPRFSKSHTVSLPRLLRHHPQTGSRIRPLISFIYANRYVIGLLAVMIVLYMGALLGRSIFSNTPVIEPAIAVENVSGSITTPTATMSVAMVMHTPDITGVSALESTSTPTLPPTPSPLPFEEAFIYGYSVEERPLQGYRLGTGQSARFIIGAIHGGYEWNTVEVVSKTLEYYREHREELPSDVALYLIPLANPDGYAAGSDAIVGRMNAHSVDLNCNWDYTWQPTATHGTRPVSAGSAPFSEPETAALRDLLLEKRPDAVIFYHSAMGVVFSGADTENSFTYELTEVIAAATGYRHQTEGIPGQITTGDAIDWLSTVGIAGTEVELTTHASISEAEWQRNLSGIKAFLDWPAGYKWYTIQEGDHFSIIAYDKCGITTEELAAINGIEDLDSPIFPGQVILIPEDCQ